MIAFKQRSKIVCDSLKVPETSPELIHGLTAIRKNTEQEVIDMFYKVAKNIHKTTEGHNIINFIRAQKLIEIKNKDLAGTKQLIDLYNMKHKNR
ncbi:MAG: hypothetical protein NTX65_14120 [Ignavibacteriales bacterium]|nr:hypothetical protein [Ignavibacteriales bacterium]